MKVNGFYLYANISKMHCQSLTTIEFFYNRTHTNYVQEKK